jgi:hypothetical protein
MVTGKRRAYRTCALLSHQTEVWADSSTSIAVGMYSPNMKPEITNDRLKTGPA